MVRTNYPVVQRMVDAHPHKQAQENKVGQTLDATTFLVLGEGHAAGMTNFSLFEDDQRERLRRATGAADEGRLPAAADSGAWPR